MLIDVNPATDIILQHTTDFGVEEVPFESALGRLLEAPIVADRNFPPFNRVTMDGIALHSDSFTGKGTSLTVQSVQPAGTPQQSLDHPGHCIEVMTGAVLPTGANAVIRYEDLEIVNNRATILIDQVNVGQNVHKLGEDRVQGALVVPSKTMLSASELAIAATVGATRLQVTKLPKIAVIATGDELVDVQHQPQPHQIRHSNIYQIKAQLKYLGVDAVLQHIVDDEAATRNRLEQAINEFDVIVLSGGVSKGKKDYVPGALADLGVEKYFHRVAQRPGKPFWFGAIPGKVTVFALPGNPVSSFMCLNRYMMPWLRKGMGLSPFNRFKVRLLKDIPFKPDLTYFAQVNVQFNDKGEAIADPILGHGSGDHANLVDANAFVELPKGKNLYPAGHFFWAHPYKNIICP